VLSSAGLGFDALHKNLTSIVQARRSEFCRTRFGWHKAESKKNTSCIPDEMHNIRRLLRVVPGVNRQAFPVRENVRFSPVSCEIEVGYHFTDVTRPADSPRNQT
jgi:hypothetical protein